MPLPPLPEPERKLSHLRGLVLGTLAAIFLFSTLLALNVLQTASLAIKPISQSAFRRVNRRAANLWWGWCALLAEKLHGSRVVLSGDDVPVRENAIVVSNHQQMTDIVVLFVLARKKERLGDLKWFVKDIIKYVPGVGWGMQFLDCLFIKRDWTADRDAIQSVFEKILAHSIPFWIISFVEGTRMKPAKLTLSQQFAKERGMAPTQHVMIPRTKGFVATVQSLRGQLDAVYDITIGYVNGVPTLWQWIKGHVRHVNLHVRRFAIDEMPEESDALTEWLMKRFTEKDGLLDYYYRHGVFPTAPTA